MSKHVGRKKRWTQVDAKTHSSALGKVVFERNAWHGLLDYRTIMKPALEGCTPGWFAQSRRLGPFKRPRDAMVALEREATFLKNRHGESILFGEQLWAEGICHASVKCSVDGCGRRLQPILKADPRDRDTWLYPECDICFRPACEGHSTDIAGRLVCDRCRREAVPPNDLDISPRG